MIECLYHFRNRRNGTLLEQIHIHLIADLPIYRHRFILAGNGFNGLLRFFFSYDWPDSHFLGLIHRNHYRHIGDIKVDHVIHRSDASEHSFFNTLDDAYALERIYYMFSDGKLFCFLG